MFEDLPARTPVPTALRAWIAGIDVFSLAPADGVLVRPPEVSASVVLRAMPGQGADAVVLGPRTRASYLRADKHVPFGVLIRVRPGCGRAVLGLPVDEIADRIVSLGDLWGAPAMQLTSALGEAGEDPARAFDVVERALAARLATLTANDQAQAHLAHAAALELSSSRARVGDIARRLNMSERQFRTLFTRAVGISPKRFSRLQRVRSVLAHPERSHLARLAADAGYYDQSHLTAEFRMTMGVTPRAFLSGRRPAPSDC